MDARSFAKKTVKLTKAQKNAIIGKKCANVGSYKPATERQSSVPIETLQPSVAIQAVQDSEENLNL